MSSVECAKTGRRSASCVPSPVTCHLSPATNEHRRHRLEPPFGARGTAGTIRLCRGENSRCAQIAARIGHCRRSRDSLDVQPGGNLRRDGARTRPGVRRIETISRKVGRDCWRAAVRTRFRLARTLAPPNRHSCAKFFPLTSARRGAGRGGRWLKFKTPHPGPLPAWAGRGS